MSGIDRQRVVGKSEEELNELICGICQDIFNDPVVTSCCRQTFCSFCINQWLKDNNNCPNDRKPLKSSDLIPSPRLIINLLNILNLKCDYHSYGCEVVLTSEQMKSHIEICDKNPENNCEFCKTKKVEINYLKKENQKLMDEIKVLRTSTKPQSNVLSEKKIIELSRIRIDDFNCLNRFEIPDTLYSFTIEKCKQAINEQTEYTGICNFIRNTLEDNPMSRNWRWIVTTISAELFSLGMCFSYNKYLKLRFHKMLIFITGVDKLTTQLKSIEWVRNDLSYVINEQFQIKDKAQLYMVELCKDALLNNINYYGVAKDIKEKLEKSDHGKGYKWLVVIDSETNSFGCFTSYNKCLKLFFGKIEIRIYGFS